MRVFCQQEPVMGLGTKTEEQGDILPIGDSDGKGSAQYFVHKPLGGF